MTDKPLMRYDVETDERVPVTQEWVDDAQKALTRLAMLRSDVRKLVNAPFFNDMRVFRE